MTVVYHWHIIPVVKGELIFHEKVTDERGNTVEIKIWRIEPTKDKPHGYKYSLVYIVDGKRIIGYDNDKYKFIDVRQLAVDFYNDIERYKKEKI